MSTTQQEQTRAAASQEYLLEMRGITKAFAGVQALKGVDFYVRPGTVHALMGENGAGKSTLMKCLFGIYHKDEGMIPANTVNFNELTIVGSKANPNVSEQVLHFFSNGAIQGDKLVTHTFPLEDYEKAVDIFEHKKDGSIKVVINP